MTFHEPKTDADIQLLAEMNRQLILDEGHRNSMTLGELYERIRLFKPSGHWLSHPGHRLSHRAAPQKT